MKLIILDRDGVINQDSDSFIKSPEEWEPIPGSLEAIARLHRAGYRIVIATNQSGIGRGLFDIITLNAIHQKMHAAVRAAGGVIDSIFFCPHTASDNCDCRKPRQGMFNAIARRYDTSLEGIPAVGDSLRDLQAGFLAGCRPFLVMTGKGKTTNENGGLPPETVLFDNLAAVTAYLLDTEGETKPEKQQKHT
ncbi:MAG: D-glycero-beta-D-manno-heptose 1,7-bisphosphate 7-phosphatase [Alistipes senegalensis]|nr:D-glycero-beta-D-manno-heptose 1,7-bisphosphate 7-phosphatase [Oxalobacter formigenes]MCM1281325.1 D-glycero-beta-D-manno-heptose 1,7-bisphosphate 7-phosphatase [Alistipes senegalensis]